MADLTREQQEDAILAQAQEIKARRAREGGGERRTEPPFDGKPCPMCPSAIRNLSAVTHNAAWRVESGSYDSPCQLREKVDRVRYAVKDTDTLIGPDSPLELQSLRAAGDAFVKAWDAYLAGGQALWNAFKISAGAMKHAAAAVQPLSNAHFADRLHSHGEIR